MRRNPGREDESEEEKPGGAAAFYLLKRTGGKPLPVEKLLAEKRHKDTMPLYSLATRRFIANPDDTKELAANLRCG
jgi:hypothetical protein